MRWRGVAVPGRVKWPPVSGVRARQRKWEFWRTHNNKRVKVGAAWRADICWAVLLHVRGVSPLIQRQLGVQAVVEDLTS